MKYFLLLATLISLSTIGKAADSTYFAPPVRHGIVLAGSFAELRATHFHAGVDIKPSTKDEIGDDILAAASGYVSRIKVQTGGYGQAIYIDHPNGYTTVYAHLHQLSDTLEAYVAEMQLAAQSYAIDLYFDRDRYVVTQGQVIGTMGNTGRSYAPHLHFEIRHTHSETPQDPALWGISAPDHKAPTLQSIGIESLTPNGRIIDQRIHYPSKQQDQGILAIAAWRIGIDVQGYDQMDGSSNHNGIYHRQVWVDDTLHWEAKSDSITWAETAYITSYYDYADKKGLNRTAVCSYVLPGNPLGIYGKRGGSINLYADKPRRIEIILADLAGNTTVKTYSIIRDTAITVPSWGSYQQHIRWDSSYILDMGPSRLQIDSATFARDVYWTYEQTTDGHKWHTDTEPVYQPIQTSISLDSVQPQYADKYCLVYHDAPRATTRGGHLLGKQLHTSIQALGHYSVTIDTIPPSIAIHTVSATDRYYLVDDNYASSGTAADVKIDVYINGEWQITPYKIMTRVLTVPTMQLDTGKHQIEIVATDDRANQTVYSDEIKIVR